MSLFCGCPNWEPEIRKLNGPIVLQSVRSGGRYQYDGKSFTFCPWCGERLVEKCDQCGAHLMPGEQAEGHYIEGPCKRPTFPQAVEKAPRDTNRCQVCGTPTFGLYCAKHSPHKTR